MDLSSLIRSTTTIPDLVAFGAPLCTSFEVRPLRRAHLAWLNEGWLLHHGVDVLDPQVRREVSSAIMREYAVSSAPGDVSSAAASRIFHADRYGGSGGSPHGGSGRCGISNLFNAKGIGRTPLVPDNIDWYHSHGFMWMDEALREAISAEIAAEELPYGAVPVIAIIDTGIDFKRDDEPARRRAIIVRPNFLRPAHFERSIHFGDAGKAKSQQYLDAMRVRQMIGAVIGSPSTPTDISLREMFVRFARQVGAARAMRLWQGRFLSSNLSVDGALVDFGSFRGVANWRSAHGLVGEIFGEELQSMRVALESLLFYFQKHAPRTQNLPPSKQFGDELAREIDAAFIGTSLRGLGVDKTRQPRVAASLEELIRNYYKRQQRDRVQVDGDYDLRRSWIYDLIRPGVGSSSASTGKQDCMESRALARYLFDATADTGSVDISLLNAQRWFRPRQHLFYNLAVRGATMCVRRLSGNAAVDGPRITRYIDLQLSRSRRHWPLLPRELEVCAQVTRGHTSVLYCQDRNTGKPRVWLEGCLSPKHFHVFDSRISLASCDAEARQSRHRLGMELPGDSSSAHLGGVVTLGGQSIRIPPAHLHYGSRRRVS